jgi:pimeloyl-ACP methyl ester carboxylesterase
MSTSADAVPNVYSFESIASVARECIPFIREIVEQYYIASETEGNADATGFSSNSSSYGRDREVVLAGWSYGGTVVAEIASQLQKNVSATTTSMPISVTRLILFDAPLRRSVEFDKHDQQLLAERRTRAAREVPLEDSHSAIDGDTPVVPGKVLPGLEVAERDAESVSHNHYVRCTQLLQNYHARPALKCYASVVAAADQDGDGNGKCDGDMVSMACANDDSAGVVIACPILDIRPEGQNGSDNLQDIQELTSSAVRQQYIPNCSHFTMLLGSSAKDAAALVQSFIL